MPSPWRRGRRARMGQKNTPFPQMPPLSDQQIISPSCLRAGSGQVVGPRVTEPKPGFCWESLSWSACLKGDVVNVKCGVFSKVFRKSQKDGVIQKALPDLQFNFKMLNRKTIHFLRPRKVDDQQLPNCYINNLALTKASSLFSINAVDFQKVKLSEAALAS